VDINFLRTGLNGVTSAAASTVAQAEATEKVLGGAVTSANLTLTSLTGLADNLAHKITVTFKTDATSATFTLDDGYGGKAVLSGTQNSGQVLTFNVVGGVNS